MVDYFVSFGIKDIIDVLCVSLLLFYLYKLMKRTGSLNMFIGILVFILVWIVVSQVLKMQLLGAVMNKLVDVGVIALIVLFADDIREILGVSKDYKLLHGIAFGYPDWDAMQNKVHLGRVSIEECAVLHW